MRIRRTYLMLLPLIVITSLCMNPKQAAAPQLPLQLNKSVLDRVITSQVTAPTVSRGEEPRIEKRIMDVSAYTDGKESTGKTPSNPKYGQTAISTTDNPVYTKLWYTIAAPDNIPIGTEIYIPYFKDKPNNGIFVVEDRGGGIYGNKLDVYFGDPAKDKTVLPRAYEFGRRNLEVWIRY